MRKLFGFGLLALTSCAKPLVTTAAPATAPTASALQASVASRIPERLSDAEFWKLQADISEPGGYFRIEDNYTSNEMEVGQLFSALRQQGIAGDVYMGVGPEQNFTYIAAVRPRMAFIVDIRRQAAMQHLMFKAMFELARDRADFVSLLFSKPRPAGLDSTTTIQKIWDAFNRVPTDSAMGARTETRMVDLLTRTHGFSFTQDESDKLHAVYRAFYYFGPAISTRGYGNGRGGDFAELTGFSYDNSGLPRSFLSSEENYQAVRSLHQRNLIVPITGDFGGPKALRAIGDYVKARGGIVRAFYLSNVEQYLFGDGKDRAFYGNVAALPVDSMSVFIRPYSMRRGGGGQIESLCRIAPFMGAAMAGRITSNDAALACLR